MKVKLPTAEELGDAPSWDGTPDDTRSPQSAQLQDLARALMAVTECSMVDDIVDMVVAHAISVTKTAAHNGILNTEGEREVFMDMITGIFRGTISAEIEAQTEDDGNNSQV